MYNITTKSLQDNTSCSSMVKVVWLFSLLAGCIETTRYNVVDPPSVSLRPQDETKNYTVMNKNNKTNNGNENHGSHCQQMSDGTFDFVPRTKPKSRSVLIRKLAHGRRSRTQDDVLQLTLKFFRTENVVIAQAIMDEAQDAIDALLNEQLTK